MNLRNRIRTYLLQTVWIVLAASLLGCSTAPKLSQFPEKEPSYAFSEVNDSTLGKLLSPIAARHQGKSGVLLLDKGEDSLIWRGAMVDQAEKSVDIQTFIWADDNVGTIAAERLLRAAERGVRVRVLVDDFMLTAKTQYMSWLDQHPMVEIRIYNPLAIPGASSLTKVMSIFSDWKRMNRRMHNKLFAVDNTIAIAGGRNIADGYFDMSDEYNYRDRDVLVTGEIVPKLSESFDLYWNSDWAVPLSSLVKDDDTEAVRDAYYEGLREYARHPENYPPRFLQHETEYAARLNNIEKELIWAEVELFADIPGKNEQLDTMKGFGVSGEVLTRVAGESEQEILGETPYLVTMPGTIELLKGLTEKGVDVRILTNSFKSTDNPPAFGAYVRKRRPLLNAGVKLYEMRAYPDHYEQYIERTELMEGHARLGLHAKTAVFDRKRVFIGSFNLDPRSTHLNTELGLLIDNEQFAQQVAESILQDMREENSWHVTLEDDGEFTWRTQKKGKQVQTYADPDVSFFSFLKMILFITVPFESIL